MEGGTRHKKKEGGDEELGGFGIPLLFRIGDSPGAQTADMQINSTRKKLKHRVDRWIGTRSNMAGATPAEGGLTHFSFREKTV